MKMGLIELSAGVSYVVGPVFGSFLYHFGGYISPFIFFSSVQMILAPIIYYIVEKEIKTFYPIIMARKSQLLRIKRRSKKSIT